MGMVGVAPRDTDFKLVGDRADYQETHVQPERLLDIIADIDPGFRAIRIGFKRKEFGLMVVGYDWADHTDDHAVSLSIDAGPLGFPEDLHSSAERRRARTLGMKFIALMRSMCEEIDPLYGAVGVELSMPTPRMLAAGSPGLGDVFVSNHLISGSPELENHLIDCFSEGHISSWDNGLYLSSWGALNEAHASASESDRVSHRAAELLGGALTNQARRLPGS